MLVVEMGFIDRQQIRNAPLGQTSTRGTPGPSWEGSPGHLRWPPDHLGGSAGHGKGAQLMGSVATLWAWTPDPKGGSAGHRWWPPDHLLLPPGHRKLKF